MPVAEERSKAWSEAAAMMDKGDNNLALEKLRESWDICENDSPCFGTVSLFFKNARSLSRPQIVGLRSNSYHFALPFQMRSVEYAGTSYKCKLGSIRECFITLTTLTVREGKSRNNLEILGKSIILGLKIQVWMVFVVIFEIYAFFYAGCTGQFIFWTYMDPFHGLFWIFRHISSEKHVFSLPRGYSCLQKSILGASHIYFRLLT